MHGLVKLAAGAALLSSDSGTGGALYVRAAQYGADGKPLPKASEECDACGFAARAAFEAYHGQGQAEAPSSLAGWQHVLGNGCADDGAGCAAMLRRGGKAMAGALLDFVADGEDADELTMELEDFQEALCSTYGEVCRAGHRSATVRSVTIQAARSLGPASVAVYRRGSQVAGMLPLEPVAVLAAGKSATFASKDPAAGDMVLVEGFAFRLLPMVDLPCPGESEAELFGFSPDDPAVQASCLISCADPSRVAAGTARERLPAQHDRDVKGCGRAAKLCKAKRNAPDKEKAGYAAKESEFGCNSVSLAPDKTFARLMTHAVAWDSPTVVDLFMDADLRQVYEVEQAAGWQPDVPLKVPDPAASEPLEWDEEEDGPWAAPLVKNTEALRQNPRFAIAKAHASGPPTPAPKQRVFGGEATVGGGKAKAGSKQPKGSKKGVPDPRAARPAAWDDQEDGLWEPGLVPRAEARKAAAEKQEAENAKPPAKKKAKKVKKAKKIESGGKSSEL